MFQVFQLLHIGSEDVVCFNIRSYLKLAVILPRELFPRSDLRA
jgi:hypothetical protein